VWREGLRGGRAERGQDTRGVGRGRGRGRGRREESGMLSLLCAENRARAGMQGKGK
jgi:hypothetical protein